MMIISYIIRIRISHYKEDGDDIDGRSFYDEADTISDYQVHAIYILAADSKDKKYDVNGTIEDIVSKGNAHLKKHKSATIQIDYKENESWMLVSLESAKRAKKSIK